MIVQQFCQTSQSLGIPFLNLIPFWIRFWQCIRKFKDSHDVYNIVNAGKYATNFIPVILAFVQALVSPGNNWGPLKIVWLVTNIFVTVYKLVWDYYKDWGLFQSWKKDEHEPFLRPNLLYPPVMVRHFNNWLTIWTVLRRYHWKFCTALLLGDSIVNSIFHANWADSKRVVALCCDFIWNL